MLPNTNDWIIFAMGMAKTIPIPIPIITSIKFSLNNCQKTDRRVAPIALFIAISFSLDSD